MKLRLPFPFHPRLLTLALTLTATAAVSAGTFKRINIDGDFADWAGVPVAATDDEGDLIAGTAGGFDVRDVYVANDENYLYVRVVIYPSSATPDYSQFHHHFFVDGDNDTGTGRASYGLGIEMLIEDAGGYSERYGTFNDGALTGLDWAQAPGGVLPTYQYEARISRAVRDVQPADVPAGSGNPERDLPVFTSDVIGMYFEVEDVNWAVQDAGSAFTYEFAPAPPPFSGTETLAALTTTAWRVNDSGSDLGQDWLAADYDDTQTGWKTGTGLFGYNAPAGVYPAPVNTTLTSGRSAYYLRCPFAWNYDQAGAGLQLSCHLSAGAVFYLNGAEVKRVRMPEVPITSSTPATGGPAQPGVAEVFDLPSTALFAGDNLLEVEVHPAAGATTSLVFGLDFTASDNFAPRIEDPSQPADRNITEGQATTFSVGAIGGTPPFTYQWLKDGGLITGATGATLTLDPVTDADAGSYAVEITNPKGLKATSRAAVLTTTAIPVALSDSALPADAVVVEGGSTTFRVTVTGTLPAYQWLRDGEPIAGANGAELTLNNVPITEHGKKFSVTVANRLNSVTSRQATLSVFQDSAPPAITDVSGGGRSVVVSFSELLDLTSAQQSANYHLDGGVQVQSAVLDAAGGQTVTLATSQQTFGQVYQVSVSGVKDRYGNASTASRPFRSSIVLDGSFDDWNSVPVALTQDQLNPGSVEFKELSITNDTDYLYLRFSFYDAPVGPLAPVNWEARGNHYDIIFDTDQDPSTGTWEGGDVLVEDGGTYRLAGGWTQGIFTDTAVGLVPGETKATDFEFRISLRAKHQADGLPAFPNADINVFMVIQTMGWTALDRTTPTIPYSIATFPPLPVAPGPISAKRVGTKIELTWPGSGTLETRPTLSTGSWTTVPGATTSIQIDMTSAAAGFYRLRQ